jgi:hypothetical protein
MPTDSHATDCRGRTQRSAVTNGSQLVDGIDQRLPAARRYRDLIATLGNDLGGDLGAAEVQQIRTAAAAILLVESLTAAVIRGEAVDVEQVTRAQNSAARLLAALKNKRKVKPTGPSLAEYLASKALSEATT